MSPRPFEPVAYPATFQPPPPRPPARRAPTRRDRPGQPAPTTTATRLRRTPSHHTPAHRARHRRVSRPGPHRGHDCQPLRGAVADAREPPAPTLLCRADRRRPFTAADRRTSCAVHVNDTFRADRSPTFNTAPLSYEREQAGVMTATVLSLISYNLKDYGKSAVTTRRQQHELLRFQRPDVVCLQEIWDDSKNLAGLRRHVATIGDALGMHAMAVPAPRSFCHMAILWRPEFTALSQRSHSLTLWHGLGVVHLDVGAAVALRVAVTHLPPWDPEQRLSDARTVAGLLDDPGQASVIAGDWNTFGADSTYDPEPQWSKLRHGKLWRHIRWDDDPDAPPQADRRPAQLLHRSGLHDAAPYLRAPWQATGGHLGDDMPRRLDAFWTTRPQALRGYRVIDTPATRLLSDHLPIQIDLDTTALDSGSAPPNTPPAPDRRQSA